MSGIDEHTQRVQAMLDQVSRPSIRFVEDVNRWVRNIENIHACAQPALQMFESMNRMLEVMGRRHKKFAEMVRRLHWPPPGHLACTGLDRLAEAYETGQVTDETAVSMIVAEQPFGVTAFFT